MSRRDLIDPESREPLDQLLAVMPGGFNAIPDIVARREAAAQLLAAIEVPPNPNVTHEDRTVPGPEGAPDISVRIYRPVNASGTLPGVYFIHGGGMILGNVEGENAVAEQVCEQVGAVVVSVEYRLAPEDPHPAQSEDCYAGLVWMARNAAELGFDPDRLAVYGGSAGGGLTIATVLLARDRGFPAIRFQMPIYPMIDHTNETASSHEITDIGVWDRKANIEAWDWYLGGGKPDQYAAPVLAEDLSGLPPAFIDVGTVDLFRDEDIAFANRLMQAGVPCELHVNPGAYHASEVLAPQAALSAADLGAPLRRAAPRPGLNRPGLSGPVRPDQARSGQAGQPPAAVVGDHVGERADDVDRPAARGPGQLRVGAVQVPDDALGVRPAGEPAEVGLPGRLQRRQARRAALGRPARGRSAGSRGSPRSGRCPRTPARGRARRSGRRAASTTCSSTSTQPATDPISRNGVPPLNTRSPQNSTDCSRQPREHVVGGVRGRADVPHGDAGVPGVQRDLVGEGQERRLERQLPPVRVLPERLVPGRAERDRLGPGALVGDDGRGREQRVAERVVAVMVGVDQGAHRGRGDVPDRRRGRPGCAARSSTRRC